MFVLMLLLAGASAQVWTAVAWRQALVLLAMAVVLCFTGAAALALHGVKFDPYAASASLLTGAAMAGWWKHRKQAPAVEAGEVFAGQLSATSLQSLTQEPAEVYLEVKERPVFVLTCCLQQTAELRKELGPFEYLALTKEFRRWASQLLLTRRGLVLPGNDEVVQACFGVPLPTNEEGTWAAETVKLLKAAQADFVHPPLKAPPGCGLSLWHGKVLTGRVGESYQVTGELLDQARRAAEQTTGGIIAVDEICAQWFPPAKKKVAAAKKTATKKAPTKKAAAKKSPTPRKPRKKPDREED